MGSTASRVFFFNDTATTEIYTLSLHDALPICRSLCYETQGQRRGRTYISAANATEAASSKRDRGRSYKRADRKSTRLNSSHANISYAVFCLKKTSPHSASGACATNTAGVTAAH